MNEEQIKKIILRLENHETRISSLEDRKTKSSFLNKSSQSKKQPKRGRVEDLHPPIEKLIQGGFFNDTKIDTDVVSELQRRLLTRKTPLRPSVVNVLRTLVRNGILERIDIMRGEKKLIAYKTTR